MAEQSGIPEGNPFDIAKIRQLVRLMRDNELSEIDLRWANSRVRIRRGPDGSAFVTVPQPGPAPQASRSNEAPADAPTKADSKPSQTINSPVVGTFYASPSPDAEPFVSVGSRVSADTIVCIVEAMKVFNEIPAGVNGVVREVLVENGAAVEYGQPLFRYEPG
jgi:acetyl-CoA carboxylase biotin carboxyl carrier protein